MRTNHTHTGFFVRAIVAIAAGMVCAVPMLRAQDCSRNMLVITGSNTYVVTPGVAALNLTKGFTIECWAKVTSVTAGAALVDKASYGIFLKNDSIFYGMVRHTTPVQNVAPPVDSPANWHHFAFTFTPGDSLRFYVDSFEVSSVSAAMSSIDSNTDSLRIGMSMAGNNFLGSIDEMRIWNVPRSLANIRQTLTHTLAGNNAGLVLYYSFDDNVGARRVHDFSGHGRDGFIRGINAEIAPSSSPMLDASPGFALSAREPRIVIPTLRCASSFDTVIHVRNLGPTPIFVDTVGFHLGVAFSIVPNAPFTLPADSTVVDSLRLHFEPNTGGVFDDSIYIASSSVCGGRIVIGVHASYDSVGLTCTPQTLNFGTLTQCQFPKTRSVTLRNTSVTDSVTIVNILLPPDSGLKVLNGFPIRLGPRQDTIVTIQIQAGARGSVSAVIGFALDKCSREADVNVTAVRARAELSMPASIDFGTTPSTLLGTTRDTTIIVTNSGDVANAISAIGVDDTVLEILDERKGVFIPTGDTLQVRVRIHALGCGLVTEFLKIKSYFCSVDTGTNVSITLTPPTLLTMHALDMGISCQPRDTAIFVSNPGDQAVRLDTISYSTNSVFFNSTFFPLTIPAHDSVPIQLSFIPSKNGNFIDTAFVQMSPCGIAMEVFKGQLGYGGLAFNASQLNFGRGCKIDSVGEQDTITNATGDTVSFASNTYSGSLRFSVTPFSFPVVLPPGTSKEITVTYTPVLGALDTGTFTFVTFEGCPAAEFHLRGSREIANATWTQTVGEFDTICPGSVKDETFDLIDRGIDSIDVKSAAVTGAGFTLLKTPATFAGDGLFTVRFTPNNTQEYSGMITILADSCGTTFLLPLHGSGGSTPHITLSDTVHDFDSVLAGDSATYCIAVSNPSCQPIQVRVDTSNIGALPFRITNAPKLEPLAPGDTAYLCVKFIPKTAGAFQCSLLIAGDSSSPKTVVLHGVGLAPDVRIHPHVIDFGYVFADSSETKIVYDSNAGNQAAEISIAHDASVFSAQASAVLASLTEDSIPVTFKPIVGTGLVYDTLRFAWNGHSDSVILRGFGTEKGLQLSAVALDFGDVHVGKDSTIPLYLFATNNFPTMDSINILHTLLVMPDTFTAFPDSALPYTIKNDRDTLTILLTYHARLEQRDTVFVIVHVGMDSVAVPVTARGVEAHPWINPTSNSWTGILLDTPTKFLPVQIGNRGDYPLYIDSIFTTDPAFVASPIAPSEAILPGTTRDDTVTFTPIRTRLVTATLGFRTSYRDSVLTVLLSGTGKYPANTGPSFGYSVASRVEEPGQNDSIPIVMNGIRLSKIDADSVVLDIRFDPQMVMAMGADGGTNANPVSKFTHLNDSTVEASIARSNFLITDTVMRLYTQALLGPNPVSYIHVLNSAPTADQPESVTDGMFTVEDCGGLVQGVQFAGPYSTNAIVPNPTADKVSLTFEIGWDAPVTLDVYNALGEKAKHIEMGTLQTGTHTVSIDVSDLPQGRYVYRLKSLDYHAEGALAIMR